MGLKAFLSATVFVIVCVAIFIWSGLYNIGADSPHWGITFLLLEEARERSVEMHSKDIVAPSFDDHKLLEVGFPHFDEMCRQCHGAPGYPRDEFAEGLYPLPPSLAPGDVQQELSPSELFWIVKHGIKMTGMPSFGKTHTDEQIWGIIAIVKKLPEMDKAAYEEMVNKFVQHEFTEHSAHE
jgi:mono/diheme cytochrome c family protein